MFIDTVEIKNFRNYKELSLRFSPGVNFIIGNNGVGKTNIIEAISILSNLRSFRNIYDEDIIKWGEQSYYCNLTLKDEDCTKYEVGCALITGRILKRASINNVAIKRASDYFGNLLTVILYPDDIAIVHGSPEKRRRFFDSMLSKSDIGHFKNLVDFKKVLISRNRILKDIRERKSNNLKHLDVWDSLFADKAVRILKKRKSLLQNYISLFKNAYTKISSKEEPPDIDYKCSLLEDDYDYIVKTLRDLRDSDIARGLTGIGPQRDDFIFANDRKVIFDNYASQGQRRTAAISLKIAEIDYIQKETGKKVIIIIDDIFSELDRIRRDNVLGYLGEGNQIICTMVNDYSIDAGTAGIKKFFISEGGIIEKQ